jgi:histidyl-tRNA synthetase
VVAKRNYILSTIRDVFELHGYQPLETPAMENLDTLLGKYGEEGDKLIFKILNNGLDNPEKAGTARTGFEKILKGKQAKEITERALKYDLTIPFARYVAMNHGKLNFPFKRYQVQPVWRADRPQKGRYREFYQCDADVIGSRSLLNEIELALIYSEVFKRLPVPGYRLQVNHRKVLKGVMEACGLEKFEKKILVIIDKFDKIGKEGVTEELDKAKIPSGKLLQVFSFKSSAKETISYLRDFLGNSRVGLEGINDLEYIFDKSAICNLQFEIDLTLARGLDYYTGIIFEVRAPEKVKMGSIGGGGRYDDLTGLFGVPDIPGVGISFGVDRIYDVMEEMELFPKEIEISTQVLFFNLGENESGRALELAGELRRKGIRAELYPESIKFDKQFKYAEKKNIPYVIIIGEEEMNSGAAKIKDIRSGKQQDIPFNELTGFNFS